MCVLELAAFVTDMKVGKFLRTLIANMQTPKLLGSLTAEVRIHYFVWAVVNCTSSPKTTLVGH